MARKNQRTVLKKKRMKFLTGVRKQECQGLKSPLFLSQIHLLHVLLPRKIVL